MTAHVPPAEVRDAYARAHPSSPEDEQRWREVLAYADAHPTDPAPARADELARATDRSGLLRRWLEEDVADAAPLLEVFTGHHRDPLGGPPAADPALVARLREWFAARGVALDGVTVLSGGFSRLMLAAEWTGGGRAVVRVEQGGMFGTDGRAEVAAMRAVRAQGYPVPEVLWEEPDPEVLGHPFFVMEHVPGVARTDDAGLDDVIRSLADLHALPATVLDPAATDPQAEIAAQLDHWRAVYRGAVAAPIPLLDDALDHLAATLRPTGPSVIVHGDPGPGNALQDEHGVTAVIDWEFAHVGDPAEDWAYLALIRGRRLGTPEEWKARVRRVAGVGFDDATWRAWEAFNQVKGACVNLTALDVFRRSPAPTPDLFAIGVAVHLRFLNRAVELLDGAGA